LDSIDAVMPFVTAVGPFVKDVEQGSGAIRCGLVPGALIGQYRKYQPDLTNSVSCRARGMGCVAWGWLTESQGEVLWTPGKQAAAWGAHSVQFCLNHEVAAVYGHLSRKLSGATIAFPEGDELRIVFAPRDELLVKNALGNSPI
jgi:hypothetical protein